jgi:hypothetical protein
MVQSVTTYLQDRAVELSWQRASTLRIIIGEILSRVRGNFEQQNGVSESYVIIIIIIIIIRRYYYYILLLLL